MNFYSFCKKLNETNTNPLPPSTRYGGPPENAPVITPTPAGDKTMAYHETPPTKSKKLGFDSTSFITNLKRGQQIAVKLGESGANHGFSDGWKVVGRGHSLVIVEKQPGFWGHGAEPQISGKLFIPNQQFINWQMEYFQLTHYGRTASIDNTELTRSRFPANTA